MLKNCAVILAGGQGNRMKSNMPKPMFKVLGEPMLEWVIKACEKSDLTNICVVKGFNAETIDQYLNGRFSTVLQSERLGTGHAVMHSVDFLNSHLDGNTLVLCGDAPFIDEETIRSSLYLHEKKGNSVTVITSIAENPTGYGRVVRNENGISAIVEQKDATEEQKKICEINSGAYWFRTRELLFALNELKPNNSQGEYYLTDTISILISNNYRADAFISQNPNAVVAANDRKELLMLNTIARMEVIDRHMKNGVEFGCTDGVVIENEVKIGVGTEILSGTILRGNTVIGEDCVIGPNCIVENCEVGNNTRLNSVQAYDSKICDNVKAGPFVHIRPKSVIKSCVRIGDFVEVKNSTIGENTAISHLTYIGDSDVGSDVNFGCGCVTVNYDGAKKSRTTIGDNAFIGCNTNLIAPVTVGNGAYTAAGTTVTKNIPDNALAIDRGEFRIKEGYALKKLKKCEKDKSKK